MSSSAEELLEREPPQQRSQSQVSLSRTERKSESVLSSSSSKMLLVVTLTACVDTGHRQTGFEELALETIRLSKSVQSA